MKILLDSNIIVYSINLSSPKHDLAQVYIQNEQDNLVVAHQNIFESLRVLTHKKYANPMTTAAAMDAVFAITNSLSVIYPLYETDQIALNLITKYKLNSDKIFDAYLAATMLSHGISAIATDNEKDFKIFDEVKVITVSTYDPL